MVLFRIGLHCEHLNLTQGRLMIFLYKYGDTNSTHNVES